MANPIHSEALQGAFDQLKGAGYQILLGTSGYSADEERALVETFIGHRVDALLLTGGDHRAETVNAILRSGTPTVEIFEFIPHPIDLNVGSSQWDAGHALGSHLVAKGHRNFAFVGHSDVEDSRIAARREGIATVCRESGLSAPRNYSTSSDPGSGGGGEIIGTILRDAPDVDVVIFAGHQIAVGAIRHAADVGIEVPGRVAIAGFGDSAMARWIRPALTTVRFPVRDMGAEAGKLLLARMQGRAITTRAVRLGYEIIGRESA
jgi:LacI family gluconate utilization system Gnt-I transcriptional repressor